MIAMALAGKPDLLIADEPTTALDATIQAQILELIRRVRRETGMAMVLISHDLGVVAENCDRVAVMYAGRVVEEAPSAELFDDPRHPYAHGLIGALPPHRWPAPAAHRHRRHRAGSAAMPQGCAFAPRCGASRRACAERSRRGFAPMAKIDVWPASSDRACARDGYHRPGRRMTAPLVERRRDLVRIYRIAARHVRPCTRCARRRWRDASRSTAGETLGLVGESGSGKSTTGRLVLGSGNIRTQGHVALQRQADAGDRHAGMARPRAPACR